MVWKKIIPFERLFKNLSNHLLLIIFQFLESRQSIEKESVCHIRAISFVIEIYFKYIFFIQVRNFVQKVAYVAFIII